MCYRPLTLRNPTRYFNPQCDPLYITVPCNECSECQSNQRNAYYVRSYYQFQDCLANGGKVMFPTFTYRKECLPVYEHGNTRLACFCKHDIQKFTNRLQERLRRINKKYKLKYIICSEYGEKKLRPHYHGVLFVYAPLSDEVLVNLIKDTWTFGIVKGGRFGWFVQDFRALKYASKYVCKDISYFDSRLGKIANTLPIYIEKMLKPFHLQSKGFGATAINYLNKDSFSISVVENGKILSFPIPQYLYRKKFMDVQMRPSREKVGVMNPTYILNGLGYTQRFNKVRDNIKNIHKRFVGRVNLITPGTFHAAFEKTELSSLTFNQFKAYVGTLVKPDVFFDFCLFSSTFKNLRSCLSVKYDFLDLKSYQDILLQKVYSRNYADYYDYHDSSQIQKTLYREKTFSSLQKYHNFALYQKIFDTVNRYIGKQNQVVYNHKQLTTIKYKNIYAYT